MERFQELNPNNCRIFIDYSGKESKPVRFEYVKTSGVLKMLYNTFFILWIMFNTILVWFNFIIFGLIYAIQNWGLNEATLGTWDIIELYPPLLFANYFFMIPFAAALLFMVFPKLMKLMPFINCLTHPKYFEKEFTIKDVKNNQVEIPLFRNMSLDYDATEDFSKYLTNFKIVEHPFTYGTSKKRTRNEFMWKAVWYFKQKPINGRIKVRFR